MRVVIDPEVCQGHLRCFAKAPQLFGADEQGRGVVLDAEPVSDDDRQAARHAVAGCPEGAIHIDESA